MKLKEIRLRQHLSQRDLAKKAKIAHATLCRLERGKHKPSDLTIQKLSEALGIGPSAIEF